MPVADENTSDIIVFRNTGGKIVMKFQEVVDSMAAMTCVISVEKLDDGRYGDVRIVTGNESYIQSIENPADGISMLNTKFVPGSLYTDYLPRDLNFEEFCYRAAVEKRCLHSYAHPDRFDVWFDMTFLPLCPDDGNICYCTYTMEITYEQSSEKMSDVSGEIASTVVNSTVKLRGATDFKSVMNDIIDDIRKMCEAEYCGILLMDDENRKCSVLCEALAEETDLVSMETYLDRDFYDLAETWEATIAGSNCLVAKSGQDMDVVKERNPEWHYSLTMAGVNNIALFPLKTHNQIIGYMWVTNFNDDSSTRIKETLELASFILASEIDNHLMMDRLKIVSSTDMLTGVKNRNEMNEYIKKMNDREVDRESGHNTENSTEKRNLGVIFADLNGLKTVNDEYGHEEGDKLLIDAAKALRRVFGENEIFRAGGDEFIVIKENTTEDEIKKDIEEIRKISGEYDRVTFALGSSIAEIAAGLDDAITAADERMYEDKARFYREHPDKNRRRG